MDPEKRERYRTILDGEEDMVVLADRDGIIRYANIPECHQIGSSNEDLIGKPLSSVFPMEIADPSEGNFGQVLGSGKPVYAEHALMGSNSEAWSATRLIPMQSAQGAAEVVLGISRDISQQMGQRRQLLAVSGFDDITGLLNRRGFAMLTAQQLGLADRTKQDLAMLFCTLQTQGSDASGGEERALIATAGVLRQVFRLQDVLARVGTREFAVLAVGAFGEDAGVLAARLRAALESEARCVAGGFSHCVGITTIHFDPAYPRSASELMARIPGTV